MKVPWKEAEERKIDLVEEEPHVFCQFLELLYGGHLPTKCAEPDDTAADEYTLLAKLYALAEMLMDDETKTTVLAAMTAKSEECENCPESAYFPNITCIKIVYDRTAKGSPARGFLVDLYTKRYVKGPISNAKVDEMPKDFLYDLTISLSAKRPLLRDYDNLATDLVNERVISQELRDQMKERTEKLKEKDQTIKSLEDTQKDLNHRLKLEEALRKANTELKNITNNELKAAKAENKELRGGMEGMRKYIPKGLHSQFYGT